ncbi:glutamate-cysteine ligase family protein [Nigerium massiliense]|uniref:glutamate-cysteine ligase family protein n=1 Tax=Nigerium massiliense TaxID=1522317 RepID=UPI00058C22C2|nr:glutamate-cysteine ligase family protein [Nigerium massiliense]
MGRETSATHYTREQRQQFRDKVRRDLDVLEQMLERDAFEFDEPLCGLEIELNLVDAGFQPKMNNAEVLQAIADPEFQTELAQFNIEFNVPPRSLRGESLHELERDLRGSLNHAELRCNERDTHIVMTGMLPTVSADTFVGEWMSDNSRYTALNDAILTSRGEDIYLDVQGKEFVRQFTDSIAAESVCTSVQLHLQVKPNEFAQHWNAAQLLAGPQLALAANSPYFFGKELWAETRTEIFAQATDTRPVELKNQGVRPRVFFGEGWITSIFDLFEENAHFFPALLPEVGDEDPQAVLDAGGVPELAEMMLHNGSIYRWNRPIYDTAGEHAHLRVENRVLPAGPTIVDTLANAAFYYGTLRVLAEDERPLWSRMAFSTAEHNFHQGARHGIDAMLYWPGLGELPASELVLRHLLPLAREGLRRWEVDEDVIDRYLRVIEGRCLTGVTGAEWQVNVVRRLEARGLSRHEALTKMTELYTKAMHSNRPVHTWKLPD